jgi:hypothetical protein
MDAPRIEQLQNTNIVNICIPFRIPLNLFGQAIYINIRGGVVGGGMVGGSAATLNKSIIIPRGAMSITYGWNCNGMEPCRIWVEGQVGNVVTEKAEMYYAPVPRPGPVTIRRCARGYEWDAVVAVPPVTEYEVWYGDDLMVLTKDCFAVSASAEPRVYARNINGGGGGRGIL